MLAFIVSRLLQSLAVMLAVSFLCFVLFNFVGDPVNNMVGQEATPAERAEMRVELGLDGAEAWDEDNKTFSGPPAKKTRKAPARKKTSAKRPATAARREINGTRGRRARRRAGEIDAHLRVEDVVNGE